MKKQVILMWICGISAAPKVRHTESPQAKVAIQNQPMSDLRAAGSNGIGIPHVITQPTAVQPATVGRQIDTKGGIGLPDAIQVAKNGKKIAQTAVVIAEATEEIEQMIDDRENGNVGHQPQSSEDLGKRFKDALTELKCLGQYGLMIVAALQCISVIANCTSAILMFIRLGNDPKSMTTR